jgi:hypothetical protein
MMRRAMLSATLVPVPLCLLMAGVCNLMLSRPVMATVSARAAVFGFVGAGALMVLVFPAAIGVRGAATAMIARALAITGPCRRLGVGWAGGLTILVVAVSSCRWATGMVVARAIPALIAIGPYRRRTDDEKAAHGQVGGPCCVFQSAEHNRPPFRVTDSRGWLFVCPLF